MRIIRVLTVLVACTSLFVACDKEEKKEGASQGDKAGDTAVKDTRAATPAATPAKPLGNKLAGLLGGSKADGEKGGILQGIDLADVGENLGDLGAAGGTPEVGAAGQPSPPAMPVSAPSATPPAAPVANAPAATGNAGKCEAVADRVLQIMKKEVAAGMTDVPPELAAELEKQLASARGQIVAECKKANWPPAVYKCLLAATDMTSLTQCESLVSGSAPAEAGGADAKDGVPTEVEPSGNAECYKVAEHVFDVMLSTASAEEREMAATMKSAVIGEVVKQCAADSWSAAARNCILGAKTAPAMEQCATKHGLE